MFEQPHYDDLNLDLQLLDTGFFHADPHPGNLIRTPDGKLAILDFGKHLLSSKSTLHLGLYTSNRIECNNLHCIYLLDLNSTSWTLLIHLLSYFPEIDMFCILSTLHSLFVIFFFHVSCVVLFFYALF